MLEFLSVFFSNVFLCLYEVPLLSQKNEVPFDQEKRRKYPKDDQFNLFHCDTCRQKRPMSRRYRLLAGLTHQYKRVKSIESDCIWFRSQHTKPKAMNRSSSSLPEPLHNDHDEHHQLLLFSEFPKLAKPPSQIVHLPPSPI